MANSNCNSALSDHKESTASTHKYNPTRTKGKQLGAAYLYK